MRDIYDPTPRTGWFARAYYTPVSDALRGKLTARLDVRRLIAAADLPAPLPGLICTVVRRSRLRRYERLDVARELIEYFAGQLSAGRISAEVVGSFGLPDQAASLLRQTRIRRRRSLWSRTLTDEVRRETIGLGLPAPLSGLIEAVVRRSRLWRREKMDVARELAAHFADGLATERSAADLERDFGAPEQAARLIRQAKLRNRPAAWQFWRIALRAAALCVAISFLAYGILAARFYLAAPNIAHNYWHDINNARLTAAPDAAWPTYREAIIRLGDPKDKDANPRLESEWVEQGPSGKHWADVVAIVERYQESIKLAREASKKPHLGYLLGNPQDREAYLAAHAEWLSSGAKQSADENINLISALLMGIQELHGLESLLRADARVAAASGDGSRVMEDLTAALALSDQVYQPHSFLVEQLVSLAFFGLTLDNIGTILADTPDVLSDAQLRDLAHAIAAYRGGEIKIDMTAEQLSFDDVLQRVYTDNGHGDGHVTPDILAWMEHGEPIPKTAMQVSGPGLSAIIASRAEMREFYRATFAEWAALHAGPPWLWDVEAIKVVNESAFSSPGDKMRKIRFCLPVLFLPAVSAIYNAPERQIQQRDATEAVITLELWRRRLGAWPERLDQLVPDLLPAVPVDRIDGQPLRYTVLDGRPILYSLGADRDDDGGQPAAAPLQALPVEYGQLSSKDVQRYRSANSDGDWILWPPLPPPDPQRGPPQSEEE